MAKKRNLKDLISNGLFEVFLIQETKIQNMEHKDVWSLWGGYEVEWTSKHSQGKIVGLLIMWKTNLFNPVFSFKGEGYVVINVVWKGISIYLVNVYSSCSIHTKKKRILERVI